jgi:molybdopterin molybdotransferase
LLDKLAGVPAALSSPHWLTAVTVQNLTADGQRESYLWGRVELIEGEYRFTLAGGSHSSGNLINLSGTNALGVIPVGVNSIDAGAKVQVLALS